MIVISGGAGVMGTALVRGLTARGIACRVLDRAGALPRSVEAEFIRADITDPSTLEGAFDGAETVYHLAGVLLPPDPALFERVNVEGTRHMVAAAAAAGVEHFIYISSASVTYRHSTRYALSKRATEEIVEHQDRMAYTIIRPTLVYDDHGGVEFSRYLDYLERFPVVPFIGRGDALKSPVHADGIARGLIAVAGNERTFGKTYNFSGGEALSIRELSKLMLRHRGRSRLFVPVPVWACRLLAWGLALVMRNPPLAWQMIAGIVHDADLDHDEATRDLDYRPMGARKAFQRCWPIGSGGVPA